jgi:hypothetical protein
MYVCMYIYRVGYHCIYVTSWAISLFVGVTGVVLCSYRSAQYVYIKGRCYLFYDYCYRQTLLLSVFIKLRDWFVCGNDAGGAIC